MNTIKPTLCKFAAKGTCDFLDCKYIHAACRWGNACNRKGCKFAHTFGYEDRLSWRLLDAAEKNTLTQEIALQEESDWWFTGSVKATNSRVTAVSRFLTTRIDWDQVIIYSGKYDESDDDL